MKPHLGAAPLEQPPRVVEDRALIEAEVHVARVGHHVDVALGHLLRPDAPRRGAIAESHHLRGLRVLLDHLWARRSI